jgi:hypothetical protein
MRRHLYNIDAGTDVRMSWKASDECRGELIRLSGAFSALCCTVSEMAISAPPLWLSTGSFEIFTSFLISLYLGVRRNNDRRW